MTKPFGSPKSDGSNENVALQSAIGAIAMAWSGLEFSLSLIVAELLGIDCVTSVSACSALDYRHRRDLISSFADHRLPSEQKSKLTKFLGEMKGMNTERNNAIHALWGNDPNTGRLMRITMRNQGVFDMQMKPVAPGHLNTVARKINALANQGAALAAEIRPHVKVWREKHPPPVPPHLAREVSSTR